MDKCCCLPYPCYSEIWSERDISLKWTQFLSDFQVKQVDTEVTSITTLFMLPNVTNKKISLQQFSLMRVSNLYIYIYMRSWDSVSRNIYCELVVGSRFREKLVYSIFQKRP